MNKVVVRLTKEEFELDNGDIFPINPPLSEDMSIEEFQEHYDRACNIIKSIQNSRGNNQNLEELGLSRKDKGRKNIGKTQKNTSIGDR